MLINFTLLPVEKIQPWGSPGSFSLSWFGLTDGQYWIKVGGSTLFEYSKHAQATGANRYCDYQVVRLYEDLMEMLPYILEPVPSSLVQYLSGNTSIAWREAYGAWCDKNADRLDADYFWNVVDTSTTWVNVRRLDSAYLSPSANTLIWSDAEYVYFEWDNRDKVVDGKPAWSAICGRYQLKRDQFMLEIRSFHTRLMNQMSERIEQVLTGILSPEINIDLASLVREHEQRFSTLDKALSSPFLTNWQETQRAIDEIIST